MANVSNLAKNADYDAKISGMESTTFTKNILNTKITQKKVIQLIWFK